MIQSLLILSMLSSYHSLGVVAQWTLDLYQWLISPLEGPVCNFSPTCSQFSEQAIEHYGLGWGIILTSDRLQRCNPFAWGYLGRYYHGVQDGRLYDPVENHWIGEEEGGRKEEEGREEEGQGSRFADLWYQRGDYHRAAVEYERAILLNPDSAEEVYLHFMAGNSWLEAGEDSRGLPHLLKAKSLAPELSPLCRYEYLRYWLNIKEYEKVRDEAPFLAQTEFALEAQALVSLSLFREGRFAEGAKIFKDLEPNHRLRVLGEYDGHNLPARRRWLATFLSAFIPGLGQGYCGRWGDGFYSFLVVGGSAGLAYYYYDHHETIKFPCFGALGLVFWAGNIYGANLSARDYNLYQRAQYLNEIEELIDEEKFKPDYRRWFPSSGY